MVAFGGRDGANDALHAVAGARGGRLPPPKRGGGGGHRHGHGPAACVGVRVGACRGGGALPALPRGGVPLRGVPARPEPDI